MARRQHPLAVGSLQSNGTPVIVGPVDELLRRLGPARRVLIVGNGGIASSGAAQAAVHLNGTEWLLATANGGIWHTDDVTVAPEPRWTPVLDAAPVSCSSISAMSTAVTWASVSNRR